MTSCVGAKYLEVDSRYYHYEVVVGIVYLYSEGLFATWGPPVSNLGVAKSVYKVAPQAIDF